MSVFNELKTIIKTDHTEDAASKFETLCNSNNQAQKLQQQQVDLLLRWTVVEQHQKFSVFYAVLKRIGANVNFVDKGQKKSNLMIACEGGNSEIVQALVNDKDTNFKHEDSRKKNCLFYAIQNKNKEKGEKYLRMILKNAPELLEQDKNSKKNSIPLVMAIQKGKAEIVKTLLELGADPNQRVSDNGNTPIYEAVKLMKLRFTQVNKLIVQYLLDKGADPNLRNKQNKSALDVSEKYEEQILGMMNQTKKTIKIKPDLSVNTPVQREEMFTQAAQIYNNLQHLIEVSEVDSSASADDEIFDEDNQPYQDPKYFVDLLSKEIIDYARECEIDHSYGNRQLQKFIDIFKPIADSLNLNIQVYGSFATKLWLRHCDIDLLLIPKGMPMFQNVSEYLNQIYLQLKSHQRELNPTINTIIKVPMIRVEMGHNNGNHWQKKKYPRKFDITIMDNNHNGKQHVIYITQLMHCYPDLQPLFYVIKKLSYSYRLNDPKNNGVRSYALILMVAYFLQQKQCNSNGIYNLGQLLLGFLYKYGYAHEYQYLQHQNQHKQLMLNLPDPINIKNNIGSQTDAFSLQRMFKSGYIMLHTKGCDRKLGNLFDSKNLFPQQHIKTINHNQSHER